MLSKRYDSTEIDRRNSTYYYVNKRTVPIEKCINPIAFWIFAPKLVLTNRHWSNSKMTSILYNYNTE